MFRVCQICVRGCPKRKLRLRSLEYQLRVISGKEVDFSTVRFSPFHSSVVCTTRESNLPSGFKHTITRVLHQLSSGNKISHAAAKARTDNDVPAGDNVSNSQPRNRDRRKKQNSKANDGLLPDITNPMAKNGQADEHLKLFNGQDPKILNSLYQSRLSSHEKYLRLAKWQLTTFVTLTSVANYGIGMSTFSGPALLNIALGTFATSAAAHHVNQLMEKDHDKLMERTRNRVLCKHLVTETEAWISGTVSGLVGIFLLYSVNELCALIGVINFLAYTCMYTPLKRIHIVNTWVGSVVGALPPLIGYAGACGYIDAKGLLLSAIMFCWQFPHFNALSWNIRREYKRAGYKMMCSENPQLCVRTSLSYSVWLALICAISPITGATDPLFALATLYPNYLLVHKSWKFYENKDAQTSRALFRYSLYHLPILMLFLFFSNEYMRRKTGKKEEQNSDLQK